MSREVRHRHRRLQLQSLLLLVASLLCLHLSTASAARVRGSSVNRRRESNSASASAATASNGLGVNPGVRARITQKGLDYGAELAMDFLMKNKDTLEMPDFEVTVGGTSIVLSGMVIKELSRPNLKISLLPLRNSPIGQLRVDVTELHPVVDANMTISYSSWLLSTSRTGSVTSTARNMTISLQASIGVDDHGRPSPSDIKCNASGDVEFELTGEFSRWSSLIGSLYDTLSDHLKPAIFSEICANALKNINKSIENDLKLAPMTAVFEEDYEFDYRLVKAPLITRNFLETSHRGGIYSVRRSNDPPFPVPSIPPFNQHSQKMAYVYVTEYVANTGWFSAVRNGDLKLSSSDNATATPPMVQRFLATSCPGSTCLGSVFPQLALLYPNSVAGVDFIASNSSRPVLRFRGRSVRVRCEGIAEFYMMTEHSRDHILTTDVTVSGFLDLSIDNNKIIFDVTNFNLKSDISRSSLNLMLSFTELLFDTFLATASQFVILPALQAIGREGAPLDVPDVPELKFIDPVIIDHNNQGVLIVGTDVQYTVPETY